MSDYYDHGDDGQTAEYLNVLFDAFGYNEQQYSLSFLFTSDDADAVFQQAGLIDKGERAFFFWWRTTGREYITQFGTRDGRMTYRFDPEGF